MFVLGVGNRAMADRELLFSLSKAKGDFIVQPFKGSGKGGQKRNKTMSACRIIHPESGAVSECQEERSFEQNKKRAFTRLIKSEKFTVWHKRKVAETLGQIQSAEKEVDKMMAEENLKIEVLVNGKWETAE